MIPQISVHLLDSAQGHPLQSWTFENHDSITIGRSPDNDIVLTDPYVSRAHAYLRFDDGQWRLTAISQRLIVFNGQKVSEVPVLDGTICRLGSQGCFVRFGQEESQQNLRATISFDTALVPELRLDQERMQQEVNQIVDAPFFQQLKDAMLRRRERKQMEDTRH
jgi:pSer/pThr/pTyr-binding forkhead associated (FHA) protein